jgi:tetratricopeptide (TPR) repeat protein
MNSNSIQIEDFVIRIVAHSRLTNYDDALGLVEAAFQMVDQFEGCGVREAEMQLLFQHAQLMSLQNRWLDAKEALEACLSSDCTSPRASDIFWNTAAALAIATAKCGDASSGEKILRKAHSMALTVHGIHGIPTLNMQHVLANFLWEAFDATSAQHNEAETLIIRTVESKRLLFGAHHSSTILSLHLMCQILSETHRHSFCESALLDLLSTCLNLRGWFHLDTIDALHLLASFYVKVLEAERAELFYLVGLCLLDYISCEGAAALASKTQKSLLKFYHATDQSDKTSLLRAMIPQEASLQDEQNAFFMSRNFSIERPKDSVHPHLIAQFFQKRILDLRRSVSSNHPAYSLVRLTEAILSRVMGQYEHARALFSSCIAYMGTSWWHHPDCLFIVTSLATVMIAARDLKSSSDLLTQASSRTQERQPHVSIQIMLSAVDMFEKAHNTELAVEFLQRVVALQSLHFGPVSTSTLSSQHLLADFHVASGTFDSAESVMWDALESCQASLGQVHETTIEWLEELCKLYTIIHNIPKALVMADASLRARVNVFGESHVHTLAAMDRHARLLQISGQLDESRKLFEHCLQLRILSQGDDASSTNATRAALAEVELILLPQLREQETTACSIRMRELEDAAAQALRADDVQGAARILSARHEIAKNTFGSQNVFTARAAASYGCLLLQMEQFQKSQVLLQQAVVALQQNLGLNSKEVMVSASALSQAFLGIGDFEHAEEILINCLDKCELSLSSHDNFYMKIVLQLGRLYSKIDHKLQTARALLQECLSYAFTEPQNLIGESSEDTDLQYLEISDDLAHVLVKLNDISAAEACLQHALEFNIQRYGKLHVSTLQAASRLGNFFISIKKPHQALPILQYVLDLQSKKFGSTSHAAFCAVKDLSRIYEAIFQSDLADVLLSLCIMQQDASHIYSSSELISYLMRRALVLLQACKYESALLRFLECLEVRCRDADQWDSVAFKAAELAGYCMMKIGLLQHARITFNYCMQVLSNSSTIFEGTIDRHRYFCLSNLGILAASEGRLSDAEKHFVACLSCDSSTISTEDVFHIERVDVAWNLAILHKKAGNFPQSEYFFMTYIQELEQYKDPAKAMCAKHSLALLYW